MAYNNVTTPGAVIQEPPVVKELQAFFESLDDAPLLTALIGPVRRGPKGHPVKVLWYCFLTKYALGMPSTAALIRTLRNNPFVARACDIPSPEAIPNEATFSRFFTKLAKRQHLHLLKDVSRSLVKKHFATLPGFGQRVAIDSTTLKAWSNGGKTKKSDKQAGWCIKKGSQGATEITYGWKLHLMVDCESEMPIAAAISPGNTHDSQRASHLLAEARYTHSRFHPKYVIADQGYSGQPLLKLIKRQYRATPIIQINKTHRRLRAELDSAMNTPEWQALFRQRSAVERVFSRLKGQCSLNHIKVRGSKKVTAHCYLALIVLQVQAALAQAVSKDIPL